MATLRDIQRRIVGVKNTQQITKAMKMIAAARLRKAQANVITRREETASTRSLLNTAKIMDENKTLYKLKELEYLEKICYKVGSISLGSGDGLLGVLSGVVKG